MSLKKRIAKDFTKLQTRANSIFQIMMHDMGGKIDHAYQDVIQYIAASLSMMGEKITYTQISGHQIQSIQQIVQHRFQGLALDLEDTWSEYRRIFDLFSRLSVGFIAKKASPPWLATTLNLQDPLAKEGRFDPRKGHFKFYMRSLADEIVKQIQRGALNEESPTMILRRIRKMFDRKKKRGIREARKDLPFELDTDSQSIYGPVDIQEGTFTLEDVDRFQAMQVRAMGWESRSEEPYFSNSLKANNKWLRDMEQTLMSDALDLLHTGQLQIGPDEMGIEDMEWVVSRPQPKCDECTVRDGLTMKEIKSRIRDEFRGDPPPLHANCRCQLVPKISDDWSKKNLSDGDEDWDPESGLVYKADKVERSLGLQDMSFDEYVNMVRR